MPTDEEILIQTFKLTDPKRELNVYFKEHMLEAMKLAREDATKIHTCPLHGITKPPYCPVCAEKDIFNKKYLSRRHKEKIEELEKEIQKLKDNWQEAVKANENLAERIKDQEELEEQNKKLRDALDRLPCLGELHEVDCHIGNLCENCKAKKALSETEGKE